MDKQERIAVLEKDINQIQLDLKRQEENLRDVQHDVDMAQIKVDNFEIDPYNYEEQFCEMLDEQGDIEIGNITLTPSDVLREMDPIAYRTGLSDYVDGLDIDNDPSYNELKEELSDLEDDKERSEELIEELQEELEKLEEELEDFENETEEN